MAKRKVNKLRVMIAILTVIVFIVAIAAAGYYFFLDPYRGTVEQFSYGLSLDETLSGEQAAADLDYVHNMLKTRHPAWLEKTSAAADTDKAYQDIRAELIEKQTVTVVELWRNISQMLAILGDAHTSVGCYYEDTTVVADCFSLPDMKIIAVDGIPTEQLFESFKTVFSYETGMEQYARSVFASRLVYEKYLRLLNIDTSDGVDFTYEDNTTLHQEFKPVTEVLNAEKPDKENDRGNYYFDFYTDVSLGVLTIKTCDFNEQYTELLWQFFEAVKEKNIKNVAVDIRENSGGNSRVINELFRYFDIDGYYISGGCDVRIGDFLQHNDKEYIANKRHINVFNGDVYVLTSADTFSSAMMLAHAVKDCNIGKIVGEPCGNMPDSYGDILMFETPDAKLSFTVSHKHFYRIDEKLAYRPVEPDIPASADTALETLKEHLKQS